MSIKERPILMSAPMVRAILAGDKMQTRQYLTYEQVALIENSRKEMDQ